jgi:hypothetical protein
MASKTSGTIRPKQVAVCIQSWWGAGCLGVGADLPIRFLTLVGLQKGAQSPVGKLKRLMIERPIQA